MENNEIEKAMELLLDTTQEEQLAILKVLSPLMNVMTYVDDKGYRIDNVIDVAITVDNTYALITDATAEALIEDQTLDDAKSILDI